MDDQNQEPTKSELKEVESLLEDIDSKKEQVPLRRKPRKRSPEEREKLGLAIASALSEYSDCYILLGFDVHGNSMVLINSSTNMESRALSDLVESFIGSGTDGIDDEEDEDDDD